MVIPKGFYLIHVCSMGPRNIKNYLQVSADEMCCLEISQQQLHHRVISNDKISVSFSVSISSFAFIASNISWFFAYQLGSQRMSVLYWIHETHTLRVHYVGKMLNIWLSHSSNISADLPNIAFDHLGVIRWTQVEPQWPLLLTWFNFNPSMDK